MMAAQHPPVMPTPAGAPSPADDDTLRAVLAALGIDSPVYSVRRTRSGWRIATAWGTFSFRRAAGPPPAASPLPPAASPPPPAGEEGRANDDAG